MRRDLLLVRHVKSSWEDPSLADHDRPLAPRGTKTLSRLTQFLAGAEHRPDIVLCSSSRRTVATLEGIRGALPKRARVDTSSELYLAGTNTLLSRLRRLDDEIRCAMLVGHNPGLEALADLLVGSGDGELRARLADKFPTGAVAALSFDCAWADLDVGAARLDAFFVPRPPRA